MNILITGSNGFIGSNLCIHELDRGNRVIGLVREINHKTKNDSWRKGITVIGDVTNFELLKRIISDYEIDLIYHLAAQSIVRLAYTNPVNTFASNVIGTVNVLEAVRSVNRNCKIIIASSDKAYGVHKKLPYTEDMDVRPDGPYATSKACADLIAQSYYKEYGINVNVVRCANVYGPGDMNMSRLIPNTIYRINKGLKPQVNAGVLMYKREMIHVDDVCSAYMTISDKGIRGDIYNIGDEKVWTVEEVMNKIYELMDYHNGVDVVDATFCEIPFQYLSGKKIKKLGWEPKIGLIDGLNGTIQWYLQLS